MSSAITIEPTKFTNLRNGSETYGYRAYDEYSKTYGNTMESIPDDDLDFLDAVLENDSDDEFLKEIIDFCCEHEMGMKIGKTFYDYDEIEHILSAHS